MAGCLIARTNERQVDMGRPRGERAELATPEAIAASRARLRQQHRDRLEQQKRETEAQGVLSQYLEPTSTMPAGERFVTHATDSRGHSESVRVNMPQGWLAIIAQVVGIDEIPAYRSSADFIRDAIWHRLEYVSSRVLIDAETSERLYLEATHNAMTDWRERVERNDAMVEEARLTLSPRNADKPGYAELVARVKETAYGYGHPWRGQVLEVVAEAERALDGGG